MTGALVIAIASVGAVSERESLLPSAPATAGAGGLVLAAAAETQGSTRSRSETRPCSAHRAVKFYARRLNEHRARMGAGARDEISGYRVARGVCPRYLAHVLQRKARAWRLRAEAWWARAPKLSGETWRDVRLDSSVNRNLIRLAICETGGINGGRPLWTHHNSVYSGALGFAHSTWAYFRHRVRPLPPPVAAQASPAEQLAVGRSLVREFGGYSSWPACHRRLGL